MECTSGKLVRWAFSCAAIAALTASNAVTAAGGNQWSSAGQNEQNTRYNASESKIGVGNVFGLTQKWVYTTDGDISATATVDGNAVYVVDHGGSIHRIDANTGTRVWKRSVQALVPGSPLLPPNKSRTSPAVAGDNVIFGTQNGAWVAAVSKDDGHLLWKTLLDAHPFAIVTQSPVVHGNRVYVGVASTEENYAAFIPGYPCCTSRGSVAALDVDTGQILWQTKMVPDAEVLLGFSGAGVWGSTAAIDVKRKSLYVTTGNNYSVSQAAKDCYADPVVTQKSVCTPADVNFDSIVALDLDTGAIKWAKRFWDYDAWNVGCIAFLVPGANPAVCPVPTGPDFDFAQGAALFTVQDKGKPRDVVGAGQKSGMYWALDPSDGSFVWGHQVGPGSTLGGLEWGSAADGTRVYAALVNLYQIPYTLQPGGAPYGASAGGWAALDAATGDPVWQIEDPAKSMGLGPVSVANGVMYACSMDPAKGTLYALDAATGATLWSFDSGASCNNGPAVANGVVYWGTGYGILGPGLGTSNNKLYAFSLK